MDADGDRKNQTIKRKRKKTSAIQRFIADVSNVLSPVWLRCSIQTDNGFERVLLGSRRRFLFNFRLFLVIVYITYTLLK